MDAKELGAMPAMPVDCLWSPEGLPRGVQTGNNQGWALGLTLRQHFAGLAMQGILHGSTWSDIRDGVEFMAEVSVKCADSLLHELAKDRT